MGGGEFALCNQKRHSARYFKYDPVHSYRALHPHPARTELWSNVDLVSGHVKPSIAFETAMKDFPIQRSRGIQTIPRYLTRRNMV